MPSGSQNPRDSPARRQRRRKTHQRIDSYGDLAPRRTRDEEIEVVEDDRDFVRASPSRKRRPSPRRERERRTSRSAQSKSVGSGFSSAQLAQLDKHNQTLGWNEYDEVRPQQNREERRGGAEDDAERERERERERQRRRREHHERKKRRRAEEEEEKKAAETAAATEAAGTDVDTRELTYSKPKHRRREVSDTKERVSKTRIVSGQALERQSEYYNEKENYREDARLRNGSSDSGSRAIDPEKKKRWRRILIGIAVVIVLLIIIIPVAVVVSKKKDASSTSAATATSTASSAPSNSNLDTISESSIPAAAVGTWLDPFDWYDTTDFNVTYTNVTYGGLPIMGLNSTWDDNTQANSQVVPLNQSFDYGTTKIRGINLGGWLSIEPFITPSLFSGFTTEDGVVDEYTLSSTLGATAAKSTIEQHYSSFVSEQTFADMQAAGFDHVRIPFSYWAITSYSGDPYVTQVAWRYLLRGIEWARMHGLRINLDLHGAPGSQNGWNHSGRQGLIGWLNGTDGTLNGQRTIDIHDQLSAFFAQPRYKNLVTMYGLVNEPRMTELNQTTVLAWTADAITAVRANNYTGIIIFGDGFEGLDNWQGKLQGIDNLLLDVHQYIIFNVDEIVLDHSDKITFACDDWSEQALQSEDTATGFGPTLCGEWSQADTDCAEYLNNVGVGSRWEGTLNTAVGLGGGTTTSVLTPSCPAKNGSCECTPANADPSTYSTAYKEWLLMYAEAQMYSFELGWGWFYWTWQTESATQWSYSAGLAAGILPALAYQRTFTCNQTVPDYATLGLSEYY